MRKVKRWRYYCGFCKRTSGTEPSMLKHETGCTLNPDRVCRVCPFAGGGGAPLSELRAFVAAHAVDGILTKEHAVTLRDMAAGCPVCMLAALRQEKAFMEDFDLKVEMKSVWADANEEHRRIVGYVG